LTRYRQSLVREQTALSNCIQKLIESGNIKLSQVVSDTLSGVGGNYFDRHHAEKQRQRLIRQLEGLGLKVTVEELAQAA
jgi:hypothetical protein